MWGKQESTNVQGTDFVTVWKQQSWEIEILVLTRKTISDGF